MSTVTISPEAEMQELKALNGHLQNRNLLLAQAIIELRGLLTERDQTIVELSPAPIDPPDHQTKEIH